MRWLALVFCLCAGSAAADPTMQVWAVAGPSYTAVFDTPGGPFTIAVTTKSDEHEVSGADFQLYDLRLDYPGLFDLGRSYAGPQTLDLGTPEAGLHQIRFGGCAAPCELRELMRVTYGDFSGALAYDSDLIVSVSGLPDHGPDPVLHDCDGSKHAAPMGGTVGVGPTGSGVVAPPGSLLLNPTLSCPCQPRTPPIESCDEVVAVSAPTLSLIKGRFVK